MKIVFLGTPEFAIPSLKSVISAGHEVLAVVCQPDKPSGRKNKITFCPVKQYAIENNIKVLQYAKIRKEGVEDLKELNPDIMITAAYGQIISKEIIDIPKYGIINVHGSLLPKYRGAAPVQWSIINGEKVTGVTIMQTDVGLDNGDMLLKQEVEIRPTDTSAELLERLSYIGADLLVEALEKIEKGTIKPEKQIEEESSYFPMIKKEMAQIDFSKSCEEICNFVRGFNPWPVAYFNLNDDVYKVYVATAYPSLSGKPGEILRCSTKQGLFIACGTGAISVETIQAPNGKVLRIKDFLNGKSFNVGDII